jgi:hypothetical protein
VVLWPIWTIPHYHPDFAPLAVAAGLMLLLTRVAYRQKEAPNEAQGDGLPRGYRLLPLNGPAAANSMSRVADQWKKGVFLFGKKSRGSASCGLWGVGLAS